MKKLFLIIFSIVSFCNITNAIETIEILKMATNGSNFSFSIVSLRSTNINIEYKIDYGDGNIVDKNWAASGKEYSFSGRVKGDTIRIYADNNITVHELDISGNKIKSLYTNKTVFYKLKELNCADNALDTLSLGVFGSFLSVLECKNNNLKSLNVGSNSSLSYLSFSNNQVESFVCTPSLYTLWCYNNKLKTIDLNNVAKLTKLYCYDNLITNLNLSKCDRLSIVYCSNNKIANIDISDCTLLTKLKCDDNQLNSISLNTRIEWLSFKNNTISNIDFSKSTALTYINCGNNNLSSISVSNCPNLIELLCSTNNLTSIDVSKNTKLTTLFTLENNINNIKYSLSDDLVSMFLFSLNNLTFSSFYGLEIDTNKINYAPQNKLVIDTLISINTGIDLSAESEVNGTATVYNWKVDSVTTLKEGVDYTINNGVTTFLKVPDKEVYCEMTNSELPKLILQTTPIKIEPNSSNRIIETYNPDNWVVYPNPVSDILVLEIKKTNDITSENKNISIMDSSGKLVYHSTSLNTKQSIDVSDLQNGVYFVKIGSSIKKIIKE